MQIHRNIASMSLEEQFRAAVKVIRSLPKNGSFQPSDEMKLTFYAYFKQATDGPNTTKKPAFYDIVNRYKWDAWKRCGDLSKDEAMRRYVDELKKVIETINMTSEVSSFLDILGPFYEFLPDSPVKNNNNPMADKLTASIQQEECVSNTVFTSYDSEGDEFTDPLDSTFYQDAVSIFGSPSRNNSLENINSLASVSSSSALNNRSRSQTATGTAPPSSSSPVAGSHKSGDEKTVQNLIVSSSSSNINNENLTLSEQLTIAIFKLQSSCDRLQSRLTCLERQSQTHEQQLQHHTALAKRQNAFFKLLFPELSTRTTILVLGWPILAHFALNYIRAMRKNN